MTEYCDTRGAAPPQVSQPQPKPAQAKPRTAQPQPQAKAASHDARGGPQALTALERYLPEFAVGETGFLEIEVALDAPPRFRR